MTIESPIAGLQPIDILNRPIQVLVAEDDEHIYRLLRITLEKAGFHVRIAVNGQEALQAFSDQPFDLILLDIRMPKMDGLQVCQEIRKRSLVPIVMLTALSRPEDIVNGLAVGADDYIVKPFTLRELNARLRAVLRRAVWIQEHASQGAMAFDHVVMDDEKREVTVRGSLVHLTPTEYRLLHYLMSRPNTPVDKEELLREVWGYDFSDSTNITAVAVRRLREKIEIDPSNPQRLLTVPGIGYQFSP